MAEAQWVHISIVPKRCKLKIKNLDLDWGKFYKDGDKSKEIPASDIDNHVIEPNTTYEIYSCGRADASSGTEGDFDLYDVTEGDTKDSPQVANYYWDCPWGSKTNTSTYSPNKAYEDVYTGGATGGNFDSGALGDITIKISKD